MCRPLVEAVHLPRSIRLQVMPEWNELIPHLEELEIEVTTHDSLPKWDKKIKNFITEVMCQK